MASRLAALPPAAAEGLALTVVTALCLVPYVGDLGFYSDDWKFLGILHHNADGSLVELMEELHAGDPGIAQRPVHNVYFALAFKAFGVRPLGYHVMGAVILSLAVLFLWAVLRELELPRALAFAVPAVYATMPNFSSARFWIAAHQATLSIALLLLGALCCLRAVRARAGARAALLAVGAALLLLSGLAYEVGIPLLVLLAALAWRRTAPASLRRRSLSVAMPIVCLLALGAFKAVASVRVGVDQSYLEYLSSVVVGAVRVNVLVYGLGLPYVLWWILTNAFDIGVLAVGAAVGIVVAGAVWCSYHPTVRSRAPDLVKTGGIAFVLGYAVFAVPSAGLSFSSASLANRIGIAAALGVAAAFVGVLAAVVSRTPFALAIGALCTIGCIATNTLAGFWGSAFRQQEAVVTTMDSVVPRLPRQSTVVLDGICFERGGAYVFTGKRDVTGLLQVRYPSVVARGSALTNRPELREDGMWVRTFGEPDFLRYGPDLIILNLSHRRAYPITSKEEAVRYLDDSGFSPETHCPPGFAWRGHRPPRG
ncbi:MAG: hypothetical protein M3N32_06490 [Actinomycetota bacterium]|nr:hypothetical protein [Actinomycetota bacterium]